MSRAAAELYGTIVPLHSEKVMASAILRAQLDEETLGKHPDAVALEPEETDFSAWDIAVLAQMAEKSVRNAIHSDTASDRLQTIKVGTKTRIEPMEAQRWLGNRRSFQPTSIEPIATKGGNQPMSKLQEYADTIKALDMNRIALEQQLPKELLMDQDGKLSIYYAPFDYANHDAKVAIVGITPGMTQAVNALRAAYGSLRDGNTLEETTREAKRYASFSGPMRSNLVNMLDGFGINQWLGIESADSLFKEHNHLVHTCSALKYPVFVDGKNYNGTPKMTRHLLLRRYLLTYFAEEVRAMPEAIFIPLGEKVAEAFRLLIDQGVIDKERVLIGFQHPSGANSERIAYLLKRKARNLLSKKTNADKIDQDREHIVSIMTDLIGHPPALATV